MKISGQHIKGTGGAKRSIKRQKKRFFKRGLPNIEEAFDGTININTLPKKYEILSYDYYFPNVIHRSFPFRRIESFGFIEILELRHNGVLYKNWGYVYFAEKSPHFTKNDYFELLGKEIENFSFNDTIEITIKDGRLKELDV